MFVELSQKPIIGILSGIGSGLCLILQDLFTNEKILKLVGAIGVWGGAMVALLTLLLKIIELTEKFPKRTKSNEKKHPKN